MDNRLKHLNALHSFEVAARHQSYSRAAEELFVSQAAISQQMRHLEQVLSTKLFVRNGRNMILTQSGKQLFTACQKGFNTIIDGLNSIQCEGIPGELTITSTQAFCSMWIMPRLYKFSQLHSEISIKIMGSNQVEDLSKKHIDVAIRFSTVEGRYDNEQHVVEFIGKDYVYPVCSPALLNQGKIDSPADLLKFPLVGLANERLVTWQQWFEHNKLEGFSDNLFKTEVTSSDLALSAVMAGHGVALAATTMFMPYLHSRQLAVPFKLKHPVEWKRYLVYNAHSAKLERIKVFCEWVKQEMALSIKETDNF